MTISRRLLIGGTFTTAAAAALLSGCGSSSSGGGSGSNPKEVIIVTDSDPDTLNPGLTTGYQSLDVTVKVYEGLIWLDPNNTPQPELATKWDVSGDNLTYTFTLRDGVTWHDGKPFTADDVKYSFETLLKDNARAQAVLKNVASITVSDPHTIAFKLKAAYAPFLSQMKVFDTPIMPKHVFEGSDIKTNAANRAPIGTGPFAFDSWQAGQQIRLKANTSYWADGQPMVDALVFRIIPEAQNRVNAIVAGDVDILPATMLPAANLKDIEGKPNIEVHRQSAIPALYFMQMNEATAGLDKVEVRQAIATAIDRARIVSQAAGGNARPGYGSFGDGFAWMVNKSSSYDSLYKFDSAKAKTALAAAGVTSLRLTYDAARPVFVAAAQIIKDNLAAAGVDIKLEPLENSVYRDKVYTKRDFDLSLQSFTSSGDPAIGYNRMYITNPGRTVNVNPTGYSNPQVDQLLQQAAAVADQAKRGELYQQAQAILDQAVPTYVLYDELQVDANRTNVTGLYAGVNPSDQFGKVGLK